MRALKNILAAKHAFVAEGYAWTLPAEAAVAKAAAGTRVKDIALFLVAPFVGLAYIIAFPLVGLGMIAWLVGKKLLANKSTRPIMLGITAPFATIALVTVAPVLGLGALVWVGARALLRN